MKIRKGFVSNSSSSSFVIKKEYLTEFQIDAINNHYLSRQFKNSCGDEKWNAWQITETEDEISGYTSMDNFDMEEYLEQIGVNMRHVNWR